MSSTDPLPRWLTQREAAGYLRVSVRTVQLATQQGRMPSVRLGTRIVRYDRLALDAWMTEQATSQKQTA